MPSIVLIHKLQKNEMFTIGCKNMGIKDTYLIPRKTAKIFEKARQKYVQGEMA